MKELVSMKRKGWRVIVPATLAVLAAVAAVAALIAAEWVEELFGWSPDGGGGEFELLLPLVLLAASVVSAAVAGWQWRVRRVATTHT
jgi:H+/Cl- antiporter ClcA